MMSGSRAFRRLVRLLFPQAFANAYGDELARTFDAQRREHATGGPAARGRFWLGAGVDLLRSAAREHRDEWRQDVRYAARTLRRTPGFTLIAVLTLALGIGASTAAFSVVHAVLIKPLPYPDAARIAFLWRIPPPNVDVGFDELPWDRGAFLDLARETRTFSHVGAFLSGDFNLTGQGDPVRLSGLQVSQGFLPSLGVQPALGRMFTTDEDRPGQAHVVILSDRLWRDRFNADRSVLGRAIVLNGAPYTVIGVMPPGFAFPHGVPMPPAFAFPRDAALWVPLALADGPTAHGEPSELAVVGRLEAGATIAQAQAELDQFAREMDRQYPRATGWFESRVEPLPQQASGRARRPVLLLFAAVCVVLLIACTNVANLLLMRGLTRASEFRLRVALGAGRLQIVRQLLVESVLLSLAGCALGVVLASAAMTLVRATDPTSILRVADIGLNLPVLVFSLAVSVITGLLFGLAPAFGATDHRLPSSLKDGRGAVSHGSRLHRTLLVGEVALALLLVVASGLLVRTFVDLLRAGAGFADPARVLTFELTLPSTRYTEQDGIVRAYQRVLERLREVPGVRAAGLGETVPLGGAGESTGVRIPGRQAANDASPPFANYTIVSPGYFKAVGTPILRGRGFVESDTADSRPVAIVSEAMARKYWPGQEVVGKAVSLPIYAFDMTIVGVAADVKHESFGEDPAPEMYVPFTQKPWPSMATMHLVVRSTGDPTRLTPTLRAAVQAVDPDLPLANVRTLAAVADAALAGPRFAMLLLGAFGVMALVLACVGLYGAVSASVARRTREMGVRMALGAPRGRVFSLIVGEGARVAATGIAVGIVASLVVLRVMTRFLYGVAPTDLVTFAAVSTALFLVALVACFVPARRATRVDPTVALRCE